MNPFDDLRYQLFEMTKERDQLRADLANTTAGLRKVEQATAKWLDKVQQLEGENNQLRADLQKLRAVVNITAG